MYAPDLQDFIDTARPGDSVVYHVGNLARERQRPTNRSIFVNASARTAWAAYQAGKVFLTQKRVDEDRCQYIATRCAS